ncbi:hypothetical protein OIU77_009706 [Salix suchowensis]|nr:hypothetical protein OIU77_009706 [Salix suchowensis]
MCPLPSVQGRNALVPTGAPQLNLVDYCEVIEKNQQEDYGKEEIDGVEKAWDGFEINGKEQESPVW